MTSKSGKLRQFLVGALALLIVSCSIFYTFATTAQTSFIGSLPPGYQVFPGQLEVSFSCSCSSGGLAEAPEPLPRCAKTFGCSGSSYTQYARFATKAEGINSKICDGIQAIRGVGFPCFVLDGDDAVVVSGTMSPAQDLTYYSFTFYQSYTYDPQERRNYTGTRSSLNLGLNNKTLKRGKNGKYAIIVTANHNTFNVMKNALNAAGVPDEIINSYFIPASTTNLGTSDFPDTLSFLLRLTFQTDQEKKQVQTFTEQTIPATKVFFAKGPGLNGDITFDDIPQWKDTLRAKRTEYNLGLDQKLITLENAVTDSYAQQGYRLKARLTENLFHLNADNCRRDLVSCGYDSPDALYSFFPCDFNSSPNPRVNSCIIQLEQNSDDVLMLLGVNHSLVGDKTLAAYTSKESKPINTGSYDGTFAFLSLYAQNSAEQYLSPSDAANLLAVKIARSCGDSPYCVATPYLGDSTGNTGFFILSRAYLDKVTGSAPNPANLIPSTLLWFTKNP
jgi:hypothetical protein